MGAMARKPVAREAVLDAFESLLIEVGERAATLDAVARRAGVSKGGLLYHFPNKEALIAVLLDRLDELAAADAEAMAAAPGRGGRLLHQVLGVGGHPAGPGLSWPPRGSPRWPTRRPSAASPPSSSAGSSCDRRRRRARPWRKPSCTWGTACTSMPCCRRAGRAAAETAADVDEPAGRRRAAPRLSAGLGAAGAARPCRAAAADSLRTRAGIGQ